MEVAAYKPHTIAHPFTVGLRNTAFGLACRPTVPRNGNYYSPQFANRCRDEVAISARMVQMSLRIGPGDGATPHELLTIVTDRLFAAYPVARLWD